MLVFTDEEWRAVYERLNETRIIVEKELQGKKYSLYEEMAKRLNISTNDLKTIWRGVFLNSYEAEDDTCKSSDDN